MPRAHRAAEGSERACNFLLETKKFLTKITNDLVMATPIDSRKADKQGMPLTSLSPIPLKNVEFRDGMGLRLVNGIPCLSAFI